MLGKKAADETSENTPQAYKSPGVSLKFFTAIFRVKTRLANHKPINYHIHDSASE